jgi:hypothetical protein
MPGRRFYAAVQPVGGWFGGGSQSVVGDHGKTYFLEAAKIP